MVILDSYGYLVIFRMGSSQMSFGQFELFRSFLKKFKDSCCI